MTTMQCIEFRKLAGPWMEGERAADAAAHFAGCPRCQLLVGELEAIRAAARELAEDAPEPPERVWVSLRKQLEIEELIRTPEPQVTQRAGGWSFLLARPALAAVYLTVLLAAAVLVGTRTNQPAEQIAGPGLAPPALVAAQPQLTQEGPGAVAALHEHNPVVTESYRKSLEMVDNFIALCEKTIREEPQNQLALDYLYGAYQQKAELLATMTERGARGD